VRAVIIAQPGGPEVLRVQEIPTPSPGPGQVLVRVAYAGCNWADIQVRTGAYPHKPPYPFAAGFEVAGTIEALGPEVRGFAVGERVCTFVFGGGYAEFVAIPQEYLIQLPREISLQVGAAFPIQALTSYHMLHTIHRLVPGEVVLVHAVGGGVGLYVTQMACHDGARVLGTVGTTGKERMPLEYGAERVVTREQQDFVEVALALTGGRGVDLAIDSLGAATLDKTFDAMRILGHVINIGEAEGNPYPNLRDRLVGRSLTFTRFHAGHIDPHSEAWARGVEYVVQGIVKGWLRVPIVEVFPLERVADMQTRLEGRGVAGKLLLAIRGDS
jgi:NADPH2:quinone reductase